MLVRNLFLVVLASLLFSISAKAEETRELDVDGFQFKETIIRAEIPYESGFFSKETKLAKIYGVLWVPAKFQQPYPVVIWSHGSQDGGTVFAADPAFFLTFLKQGFAVLYPFRKSFSRKGYPASDHNVEATEPIQCNNYGSAEAGVKSAMADVKGLRSALSERKELDLAHVVLMGGSRGGFLSLALAADDFPGLVGVINFSGGWFSESCYGDYNSGKFAEFGKKIRVPVVSLYGDVDRYYSVSHIRNNLNSLDRGNDLSSSHIFEGGDHAVVRRYKDWQPFVQKLLDQARSRTD